MTPSIRNKTVAGTILSSSFNAYVGVGSGAGKNSFFENNSGLLTVGGAPYYSPAVTVDYAGSDSLLTDAEENAYNAHPTLGKTNFGRLIQVPVALTSVNLTSVQLAQIFADPSIVN
ncbi:hypothetical protein [Variovorax sp. LT1R16]|uniref:hypothetical protein n=1 Tax=Variovorax sp. LT1R16 TaxID=3443728 RepID=UPI003F457EE5